MIAPHHTYDLLIILAVLSGMAFAALRAIQGRKATDPSEYFLARRDIGWLSVATSLFAAAMWGFWSLILAKPMAEGLTGWILPAGVVVGALVMLGMAFVSPYAASKAPTMPSFLGKRFGRQVSFAVALASIALTLFVHIPFTILIGTQMVNTLMGWDLMSSGLLIVVIPGLFVVAGGYPSAIAAQSAGGIAAGVGLLFLAVNGVPAGSDGALHRALPEATVSWPAVAAGMAVLGLWSFCMEQHIVQRVFAARSRAQGRVGSLVAAALVVLGAGALVLGSESYGSTTLRMESSGVAGGFIVATVIAFAMASLTGHFMSISTLITMDIVQPARSSAGDAALVLVGRLTNTVVVILAIVMASSISLIGSVILDWMVPAFLVVAPPIVAVAILGQVWPRMHGRGAVWALVVGWVAGLLQVGMNFESGAGMLQTAVVTFALSAVVFVSVSLTVAPLGTLGKVPGTILQVRKP